jgi:hypothetical protein
MHSTHVLNSRTECCHRISKHDAGIIKDFAEYQLRDSALMSALRLIRATAKVHLCHETIYHLDGQRMEAALNASAREVLDAHDRATVPPREGYSQAYADQMRTALLRIAGWREIDRNSLGERLREIEEIALAALMPTVTKGAGQ